MAKNKHRENRENCFATILQNDGPADRQSELSSSHCEFPDRSVRVQIMPTRMK